MSQWLDLLRFTALLDLSHFDWRETRHAGVALCVLRRDEATGDATVLIRMRPGASYPAHRHTGAEEVFILQGGYRDRDGEHRAGEYVLNDAGSAHHPTALEGADDCVMLAVAHGGIEILKP